MHIDLSTVVKQAKDQISCELDEQVAILNTQSALYFGLDEVGAVIWQELGQERTVKDICQTIIDQFDVDEGQCQSDVIEFLNALVGAALVEISTSASSGNSR